MSNLIRRAWRITPKAGSFKRLHLVEEPLGDPGPYEVRIAVRSIGLNFADLFAIFGLYKATPKGSFVPGLEFSGVVESVGDSVTAFKTGDKVLGSTRFGGYTSHLNINERYVIPLPEGWSFEEGAAITVQALTAYYALFPLGALQPGQTVLIHSAAGGVGILANRLAKKAGAYTIGSVGNSSKVALLKQEGYDAVIVRGKDFGTQLHECLGERPLNLILDCIGGKVLSAGYKALAPMGRLIVYGSAHYAQPGDRPNIFRLVWKYLQRPKIDPQNMTNQNKGVLGFNLIFLYDRVDLLREYMDKIMEMDPGKPIVGHRFEFEQLKEALHLFLSGQTTGKVVVNVPVQPQ